MSFSSMYQLLMRHSIAIIVILAFIFPFTTLLQNESWIVNHEHNEYLLRTDAYYQALREWNIRPRWTTISQNTFGNYFFGYYPPLVDYVNVLLKLVTGSSLAGVTLLIILISCICAFGVYAVVYALTNNSAAAIIASYTIIYNHYRITNLYERGGFAESLAFALIPWVIVSLLLLIRKHDSWARTIFAITTISLLLFSHTLTTYISALFILVLCLVFLLVNRQNFGSKIARILFVGLASLCVTTTSWLPVVFFGEQHSLMNLLVLDFHETYTNFDPQFAFENIEMILIYITTFFGFIFIWIKKNQNQQKIEKYSFYTFLIFSYFAYLLSKPELYNAIQYIPRLNYIQFSFRFLGIYGYFISIAIGIGLSILLNRIHKKHHGTIIIFFFALIATASVHAQIIGRSFTLPRLQISPIESVVESYEEQRLVTNTHLPENESKNLLAQALCKKRLGPAGADEYAPQFPYVNIEYLRSEKDCNNTVGIFINASSRDSVESVDFTTTSFQITLNDTHQDRIDLLHRYTPEWKITKGTGTIINSDGLLRIENISPETKVIELRYKPQFIFKLADFISLCALLILCVITFIVFWKQKKGENYKMLFHFQFRKKSKKE